MSHDALLSVGDTFNTYRVPTLKGGTLLRPWEVSSGHGKATGNLRLSDVVLFSCSQPASPRERPNFVFFDLRSKEVGCVRRA